MPLLGKLGVAHRIQCMHSLREIGFALIAAVSVPDAVDFIQQLDDSRMVVAGVDVYVGRFDAVTVAR